MTLNEMKVDKTLNKSLGESNKIETISGLQGFLILVILSLVFGTFMKIYQLKDFITLYMDGTMKLLNDSQSELYSPDIFKLINFEFIGIVFFILFSIVNIYLYFKMKKSFIKFQIIYLCSSFVFFIVITIIVNYLHLDAAVMSNSKISGQTLSTIIWVAYMVKSKRVKNTFVN